VGFADLKSTASSTMSAIELKAAEADDEAILWLMLTFAASMGAGGAEQIVVAKSDPYLRAYVEGWGSRKGDVGVVARDQDREPLGAAWLRLGGTGGGRFKLGDDEAPELATAVAPRARGQGVGTLMIKRLIEVARPQFPRITLSVREENPAVRFYLNLGFREDRRAENRVGGVSLVMSLDLR
jgi:ribosomal protein S18 acetylase RimI-like enzyme